jgi:hypothetical protein
MVQFNLPSLDHFDTCILKSTETSSFFHSTKIIGFDFNKKYEEIIQS